MTLDPVSDPEPSIGFGKSLDVRAVGTAIETWSSTSCAIEAMTSMPHLALWDVQGRVAFVGRARMW